VNHENSNTEQKQHIWEFFELSLHGEVDPEKNYTMWHWLMHPMVDMLGPDLVYAVGIECLKYPPTWVDTKPEADLVEAAIDDFLNRS